MSASWRAVGLSYLQYANMCAQVTREALATEAKTAALARSVSHIKNVVWKGGVPQKPVFLSIADATGQNVTKAVA